MVWENKDYIFLVQLFNKSQPKTYLENKKMLRLFKKKYAYPEVKCPRNAREMTDEEMLLVNGGSERRENSHEGVANANVGDTIERKDGTVVTLNQGDIDYAKAQLGISDSGSGTSVSGSVGNSGSNGNTPSSPSSPSSPTKTNDATANTVKGPDHHSAYDQQYINEMMENARKNALSGNVIKGTAVSGKRIEGQEIKVNPGAGNMTVSDYIALQKKMGAGATVSGQTNDSEDAICWDQVRAGALDMVLGIGSIVEGGIIVGSGGVVAPMGYIAAKEGITLFCYGMAEFGSGLQGNRIPNSLNLTIEQCTFGLAETDFDRWGQQ